MAPRFGATKFRNAVPTVPPRDAWYRSHLTSSAPANTVVYSSVVKTNTQHVVTLTPAGDASVRGYDAVGEHEGDVWAGKFGAVADWDLSRLEDGGMYVAGTDGTVAYYTIDGAGVPTQRSSINSKVSCVAAHPTTAGLALGGSNIVSIYDVSASTPALTLTTPNEVALWSAAWNCDGRLIAGVTKKGSAAIWDVRAGAAPQTTRDMSSMLQALKPVRVAFAGNDVFITSFSRSRSRQYSLLTASEGLAASFTASVDTSQGPLAPVVDEERRIVFLAGKGDMTLRQVELSGPEGYQEVVHPLPSPLTSSSVALAHWSTLPVMEAQVETVILPTQDKDGDTLLPLVLKVPRRQLIDYHGDLYPDPMGTVPEQTAQQWLDGGDNMPLRVSVDPARRGEWERNVAKGRSELASAETSTKQESAPEPAVTPDSAAKPDITTASASTAGATSPTTASAPTETAEHATPATSTAASTSAKQPISSSSPRETPSTPPPNSDLPPLADGESYSSTSYKIRNVGPHILAYQKVHAASGAKGPLMVGFQGPQGCGKTTLCDSLLAWLKEQGLRPAVLSLDDLYLPHDGLKKVAEEHPDNPLLSGRGPPGTHDVDLAVKVLQAVKDINGGTVELPIFDKSLCDGEGDRSTKTVSVQGPIDVFVLEGWSFGFGPLTPEQLTSRYAAKDGNYFPQYTLKSLEELNSYLGQFAEKVYPFFSAFITVEPTSYEYVFRWRLQQEHNMKASNGGMGLSDDQVHKFVERYMPAYELWTPSVRDPRAPWAGRLVRIKFGEEREVLAIETPEAGSAASAVPETDKDVKADQGAPAATAVTASTAASAATASTEVRDSATASASAETNPGSASQTPPASAPSKATPSVVPSSTRFNPDWSRKYIAGKSPLIPSYDHLPPVVTLHQDSIVLRANNNIALFAIDGPGGRVCVHPLSKRGRLPVGGIGYLSGGVGLADFAADMYSDNVVLAGEDGVLRVWSVGKDGIEGAGPEPAQVLRGNKIDKIVQIAFHPTAKDLLVVATNDHGEASLRFFDLAQGKEVKQVELGIKGITGFAFSPKGDRVAVATKDSKVVILDPRDTSTMVSGTAHASPRSFQLAWVDDSHLVSLGFGRGSVRQLNLYSIGDDVATVATQSLDVSPGVLFPVYDPDTNILQVWGKGERTISAYEIKGESINKLSDFTGSSPQLSVVFQPKTTLDVKKVEVAHALRLTASTLENVSFTIPRNRPEFFQDDIYVPTLAAEPSTAAKDWLAGSDAPRSLVDLCPAGMTPLSQAPAPAKAQKPKFVPAANVMTAEERKKQEMDEMFQKAKIVDSSDEEDDGPKRGGIPPPDDDW